MQVVKEEITEIKEKYASPRRSRLVFSGEEADELLSRASEKQPGVKCTLVYTADDKFKVLTGKQADALNKPLEGKFKPQLVACCKLETVTDRRIFAFTNLGNCHKLDIYSPDYECKLSDAGVSLKELSKDAEEDEKVIALFEIGERFPVGKLMFFTRKGMIKKTEWSEYDNQRKDSFLAVKLVEEDEVIAVEEETSEEDTIIIVTKDGICLNAKKDDVPTQGRIAAGVRGIMLHEGDRVVLMSQINGEGEIIIATSEGKFKKVISSQIEPMGRYKKGSMIVGLREGDSVLLASYVTKPYTLAVVEKNNAVSELSSEDIPSAMQSAKARKLPRYAEGAVVKVLPLPYRTES